MALQSESENPKGLMADVVHRHSSGTGLMRLVFGCPIADAESCSWAYTSKPTLPPYHRRKAMKFNYKVGSGSCACHSVACF
jgi:hypothetical protein